MSACIRRWRGNSLVKTSLFLQQRPFTLPHSSMATVVPCASCYARSSVQPLQLFGRGPRGANYLSLITYRGPRSAPRPRLTCHAPRMTLRQICRLLRIMKQVRNREAATPTTATAGRKQGAAPAPASPNSKTEKKGVPCCFRRRRNMKRFG